MKHEKEITRTLNDIETPAELENKLRKNWQLQLKTDEQTNNYWRPGLAIAASFMLLMFVSFNAIKTPAIIDAAAKDILTDAKSDIGLSVPAETLLSMFDIQFPPEITPVKMTKFCNIDGLKTAHIQVKGQEKGEVHFFVKQGEFNTAFWQQQQGVISEMPWKIINTDNDLSVLVLHSKDMNSKNVDHMINQMFFA